MTAKKKRTSSPVAKPKSKVETCFTIMPFGGWFDNYYTEIYVPAIQEAGLEPHRADDLYRPSAIVHDIWEYTKQCRLVLADLTGKNPNVFYELGLAHAIAKPAILVAQDIEDVPFDLRSLRVILYDKNSPEWGAILKDKIRTALDEALKSPVESVLPAFLNVKGSKGAPEVSAEAKQLIEVKQDVDALRRELRASVRSYRSEGPPIEPDEVSYSVKRYLRMQMPEDLIVERLRARGASVSYIRREIARHQAQPELQFSDPPPKADLSVT